MEDFIISQLLDVGLTAEHLLVFEENEIGTQEFYSLTMEDLRILFPNKLGIALKVIRVLQSFYTYEMQCQDFNNNSGWKGPFVPAPPMVISTMQPIDSQQYDGTSLPDSGPNSESIPLDDETEVPIPIPTPIPTPARKQEPAQSEIHMSGVSAPEYKMLRSPDIKISGASVPEFKMSGTTQPEIKMTGELEHGDQMSRVSPPGLKLLGAHEPFKMSGVPTEGSDHAIKYEPMPPREKTKFRQQSQAINSETTQIIKKVPDSSKTSDNPEITKIPETRAVEHPVEISNSSPLKTLDAVPVTWSAEMAATEAGVEESRTDSDVILSLFSNLTDTASTSCGNGGRKPIIMLETPKTNKTFTIPREHHRFVEAIINSSSSDLHKLTQSTSTEIKFPRKDNETDQIKINGSLLFANQIIEEIHRIVQKRIEECERFQTRDIEIEKSLHGYVVGRRKKNIHEVLERTGVTVDVPSANSPSSMIKLCGLPEKLDEAEALVRENCNPSASLKEVIEVNPDIKNYLLAKDQGGVSKIDEIRKTSGAQIVFSDSSANDINELTIGGTMAAVRQARRQIQEVINEERNKREIKLDVDPKYYKYFLKNSAKLLRDIENECPGIRIHIPKRKLNNPTPTKIHLRGSLEFAQSAKDKIWKEIAKIDKEIHKIGQEDRDFRDRDRLRADPRTLLKSDTHISNVPRKRTTSYVEINSAVYSRIIGLFGRGISKIQNDYGVHVQFPKPTDSFPNTVQISGMEAVKVSEVERLLIDLESKYKSETKIMRPTPLPVPGPSRTLT